MITIVDYGMANLRSVQKAFERQGHPAAITGDPAVVAKAERLVLPGVGAFRDAIARLREAGLDRPILDHVRADRPFLGICLGMQLLFTKSYEDGEYAGLDVFPGEVVRFTAQPGLKIPHMGWNQLRVRRAAGVLAGLPEPSWCYFVHSYYVVPKDAAVVAAEADYPAPFTAVVGRGRVWATQFHPEKSQQVGLALLDRFARM
jgi:glutamine amidotransferase